jgi:hypothetical protein
MKAHKLLLPLLILLYTPLFGCDICGCFMGIVPNEKESSIGLYYRYRAYVNSIYSGNTWYPDHGNMRIEHGSSATGENAAWVRGYEVYRVTELRARYFLHPKLEVNLVLPYLSNTEVTGTATTHAKGFGDMNVYAGWYAYEKVGNERFKQRLLIGLGVKAPSGACNQSYSGKRVDILLQTGTGSIDPFLYFYYSAAHYKWGGSLAGNYKFNGENKYMERIGNSATFNLSLFYKIRKGLFLSFMPGVSTAMNVLMGGGGLDIYYRQFSLSYSLQVPIHEVVAAGAPASTVKTMAGIAWHFSQSKFLLNKSKSTAR